jgi:hypothetical protein
MVTQPKIQQASLYYWAGPGAIRMTKLKYPGAQIDAESFLKAYDFEKLQKLKKLFNLTDIWVTYSWGFSEKSEQEDYKFIEKKLLNFQKLNLKTHAYIQGFNLVYEEHKNKNYFCRDPYGNVIAYHRGRKMTCPNNPFFVEYLIHKIKSALSKNFDGIFIDNICFGQFPIFVGKKYSTFFGCCCQFCQEKFAKIYGYHIPKTFVVGNVVWESYIQFRVASVMSLLSRISKLVRVSKKQFGTNSFDPRFNSQIMYGTDMEKLQKIQNYILFENHDLPNQANKYKNNLYLKHFVDQAKIPVFVVSYKNGIGKDPQFSQKDYDAIFSESRQIGYLPCYKGTEFITNNVWHTISSNHLKHVKKTRLQSFKSTAQNNKILRGKFLLPLYNQLYNPLTTWYFESKFGRKMLALFYYRAIR